MSHFPDLVIANGTVVNSFGRQAAHVVVDGGRIVGLVDAAEPIPSAARTIEAHGQLVIPGGIDGHCHIAQVTGRFRTLDDYRTTSTAALWGGTTTIIDFGIPRDAQETPLEAFASAQGNGTTGTASIVSDEGQLVFAAIVVDATDQNLVPDAGQTERWDLFSVGAAANGGGSTEAGAAIPVDMSWSWASTHGMGCGMSGRVRAMYGWCFRTMSFSGLSCG